MIFWGKGLRVDKIIGQIGITEFIAPHLNGVIHNFFFAARSVFLQHFARIGIGENRLNPRTDIAGIKANSAGWGDGCEQSVSNAMRCNFGAHILIHSLHRARGQIRICLKERKRALFLGQLHRGQIGGARDRVQPIFGLPRRCLGAIAQAKHQ